MLSSKLINFILFSLLLKPSQFKRRIQNGTVLEEETKNYVVYLVKASASVQEYDAWICGGALVTKSYVVTSAACVEDVVHMYVIAGYDKYVQTDQLTTDPCTSNTRKKVVLTCVPKVYDLSYDKLEKWANIDIALAKVESPYDFNSNIYIEYCSYIPNVIEINYEDGPQADGTSVIVYGWGHLKIWRSPEDTVDYNQKMLNYATAVLEPKEVCKREYSKYKGLPEIIQKYMLCTIHPGNMDPKGNLIDKKKHLAENCIESTKSPAEILLGDSDEFEDIKMSDLTRRNTSNDNINNISDSTNETRKNDSRDSIKRRNGICQNDHGGPLISWSGGHEVLIGVASVFKVTEDFKCAAPYLYTSTKCNGKFLDCVLSSDEDVKESNDDLFGRRTICDQPPEEKGFDLIKRTISWINHPDGPAENEVMPRS